MGGSSPPLILSGVKELETLEFEDGSLSEGNRSWPIGHVVHCEPPSRASSPRVLCLYAPVRIRHTGVEALGAGEDRTRSRILVETMHV